jgi:hypothetical protein
MTDTLDDLLYKAAEDDHVALTGSNSLGLVSSIARELLIATAQLGEAEELVKERRENLRAIREQRLPDAMAEVGLTSFTLDTGDTVTIKNVITASLPNREKEPELRAAAFSWLIDNGYEDLIKYNLSATFDKGFKAEAETAYAAVIAIKGCKTAKLAEDCHYQTLNALIRQLAAAGSTVPADLFHLYQARVAEIGLR